MSLVSLISLIAGQSRPCCCAPTILTTPIASCYFCFCYYFSSTAEWAPGRHCPVRWCVGWRWTCSRSCRLGHGWIEWCPHRSSWSWGMFNSIFIPVIIIRFCLSPDYAYSWSPFPSINYLIYYKCPEYYLTIYSYIQLYTTIYSFLYRSQCLYYIHSQQ